MSGYHRITSDHDIVTDACVVGYHGTTLYTGVILNDGVLQDNRAAFECRMMEDLGVASHLAMKSDKGVG
jgi:hypothetical protein